MASEWDLFVDESGNFSESDLNIVGGFLLPHDQAREKLAVSWLVEIEKSVKNEFAGDKDIAGYDFRHANKNGKLANRRRIQLSILKQYAERVSAVGGRLIIMTSAQHYTEEIKLDDLAALVAMSPSAFSRFFKQYTGRGPVDYIIDVRMGVAARMLVDTTTSVSEICYACGFNNLSNFNRTFKARRGYTPRDFRALFTKNRIYI